MDPRVIDIPYFQRTLLVKGIIARTRAPKSAKVYETIWDKETGSPLMHYSILQRICFKKHWGRIPC
jgi:ferrochelatase